MSDSLIFEHYPLRGHVLPVSWLTVSIGQVARSVASGFPSGAHNPEGKGVPHIRPMNIDREGRFDLTTVKCVEEEPPKLLCKGDVLFNNTNSPELIGKTTAILVDTLLAYSNHMTRIQLEDGLNPVFVARQLHFLWMSGYFRHRCKNHVNQASISAEPLADSVPLLLPPAPEQERIADALDELLSDLDAGVAALERVQAKLKHYRAAVLKAAVEGALTAEWRAQHPATETASALLTRILAERRRRWEEAQLQKFKEAGKSPPKDWKAKYEEPSAPDATNLPHLPEGWCWSNLDQMKLFSLYGPRFSSADYADDGVFVLRTSDISDSGIVDLDKAPRLKLSDDEFEPYALDKGDILFTRTGSIGRLSVFNDDVSAIAGAYLIQYRLAVAGDVSWYVSRFFQSPIGQNFLIRRVAGVGRPNLNAPNIESIPISLPPMEEMLVILDSVAEQLSVVDHLEADLETKMKSAQALRQSILRHAFTGQLVPQDPKDEPASELLKRIAAQRKEVAQQAQAAKKTKSKAPQKRAAKQTRKKTLS